MWNWNCGDRQNLRRRQTPSTRTNVELKRTRRKDSSYTRRLLLEPMWNWNDFRYATLPTRHVASTRTNVELKQNLKPGGATSFATPSTRTNVELKPLKGALSAADIVLLTSTRTNVELKLIFLPFFSAALMTSTRTNVELKRVSSVHRHAQGIQLLLEPMWNWNNGEMVFLLGNENVFYSNQCGIETFHFRPLLPSVDPSSTRTNVELKPRSLQGSLRSLWASSTRTNVELKRDHLAYEVGVVTNLLLEPMWNWNELVAPRIQNSVQSLLLEPMWNWNRRVLPLPVLQLDGAPSTRTNVELKPCLTYGEGADGNLFYSNQCGIETRHIPQFCEMA